MRNMQAIWNEFLSFWTVERVKNMQIDDYTNLDKSSSFCYWLESTTEILGSIWGGSAYKFGIYKKKNSKIDERSSYLSDGEYAWVKKYGLTKEDAFDKVKELVLKIIDAAINDDISLINDIDLGDAYKWKIAALYHKGLPLVYKKEAINYLIKYFNKQALTSSEKYIQLLTEKREDENIISFSGRLWNIYADYVEKEKLKNRYWLGKISHDNEKFEYAIKNNVWLMQQQYQKQENSAVTNIWSSISKIKKGDFILLGTKGALHAIGKVIKPRNIPDNHNVSSIKKTIKNNNHVFFDGFVTYEDSEVFYENFTDFNGNWAQRIDVEKWLFFSKDGINSYGLKEGSVNNLTTYSIYGIKEEFFKQKEKELKIKYRDNMSFIEKNIELLESNKNLIFTGAPGTGKTYLAKEIAKQIIYSNTIDISKINISNYVFIGEMIESRDEKHPFKILEIKNDIVKFKRDSGTSASVSFVKIIDCIQNKCYDTKNIGDSYVWGIANHIVNKIHNDYVNLVQFHPSYDYTDFVEGLRPVKKENEELGFELKNGTFKAFCKKAKADPDNDYVFIIDEINRAEISKVFGELFYSIEPDYRGTDGKVKTQYENIQEGDTIFDDNLGKGWFYIPENVYIIGTMNDIDRSVESFDFAMRRRFAWKEIKADDRLEMWDGNINNWKIEADKRMKKLNAAIEKIEGFNSSYHIGPAYFLHLKKYDGDFAQLWQNHIEVLLQEYLRGMRETERLMDELEDAYNSEK